jgi:hypothetical protein
MSNIQIISHPLKLDFLSKQKVATFASIPYNRGVKVAVKIKKNFVSELCVCVSSTQKKKIPKKNNKKRENVPNRDSTPHVSVFHHAFQRVPFPRHTLS